MLKFNSSDIELIIKNDPSIEIAKYSIKKNIVAIHKKSKEVILNCQNEKKETFDICYVEIEGENPNIQSLLSYGQNGYILSEDEESKFLIKENNVEMTEGFINHVSKSEVLYFLKAEKKVKTLKDFNEMSKEYISFCKDKGFEVNHFRSFILDFENDMKKFKPSRDYVFNETFNKLTQKG